MKCVSVPTWLSPCKGYGLHTLASPHVNFMLDYASINSSMQSRTRDHTWDQQNSNSVNCLTDSLFTCLCIFFVIRWFCTRTSFGKASPRAATGKPLLHMGSSGTYSYQLISHHASYFSVPFSYSGQMNKALCGFSKSNILNYVMAPMLAIMHAYRILRTWVLHMHNTIISCYCKVC